MKSLARWSALSLLAAPVGAWALSLGEIDVRSALNQPFAAEIALSGTPEEFQSLNIGLASPETFARYGLDRPAVLGTFVFRVGTNDAGRTVVRITSTQSIAEPFMELLVEASSRSGRFLHQYTVFLDPPTFLSEAAVPAVVEPPEARAPQPSVAGGVLPRNEPPARVEPPRPAAQAAVEPPVVETPAVAPEPVAETETAAAEPPRGPLPSAGAGGSYGPVQRGETLWGIASDMRGDGITMNQMMFAIFEANPEAFDSNMNVLRRGAILRIPERAEVERVDARTATAEFQRQTEEWQSRSARAPRLVLVPPSREVEALGAGSSTRPSESTSDDAIEAAPPGAQALETETEAEAEDNRRLLEIENSELSALEDQLRADADTAAAATDAPAAVDPGVELESEQLFADEVPIAVEDTPEANAGQAETEAVEAISPPVTAPTPAPVTAGPREPSLVDQALGWLATPIVWIAVGGLAVLLALLLFLRRRRTEVEDVTGQWEALEAEVDDDAREATSRMRQQVRDEDFLVQEQRAEADESAEEAPPAQAPARAGRQRAAGPEARAAQAEAETPEPTLSSQTVINLDQADPIAEADFHMAYGLYDQAADLVTKALKAKPDSRELKLKLLEVFFVWGNKDAFLKTAEDLRKEMGARPDADWDKVIIMGKQICPEETLFASATAAAGAVDVDLEAGGALALDLAFDAEDTPGAGIDLDFGLDSEVDLALGSTGERPAPKRKAPAPERDEDALDIGERTQQGLEEALLELDQQASETTPDLDSLAVTQESPTVETPRTRKDPDWGVITMESPTVEQSGPRTATVARPSLDDDSDLPTVETPTLESTFGNTHRAKAASDDGAVPSSDYTAELNLDDLGLDIADIEGLPNDLGELPSSDDAESDTRDQPRVVVENDLLSATGVTEVLLEDDTEFDNLKTAVLGDDDVTMMAPGFERERLASTDVIKGPLEEVGAASGDDALDLDLDDFSAALSKSGDTVEQPRTGSFERSVFAGGATPIDMDIGADVRGDDEPTGTEEVNPIDPQTMTEVGTKLDLARAYIDMGDPEGARSILEEVLDEGDAGQRREAQSLINALPA